jgi:hypothetical protein
MRIDTAENDQQQMAPEHAVDESREPHVMQIEPDNAIEIVLMALRLQSEPVIFLLPEGQSEAFSDPSHFARLREVCDPGKVSFLIPRSRIGTLARYAHHYGFAFASSLEKASQFLTVHKREQTGALQQAMELHEEHMIGASSRQEVVVEDVQKDLDTREGYEQQTVSTERSPQSSAPLQEEPSPAPVRPT